MRWANSLLLAWLAGCGAATQERPGVETGALVGGAPAPSANSVCALTLQSEAGELGLCSGTILSPHLLLTAAHCVAPGSVGKGARFSVSCSEHVPVDGGVAGGAREVAWVLPHPDFDASFLQGGADVGLVSTKAELPAEPLQLRRTALSEDGGSFDVMLFGYGAAEAGGDAPAGDRRQLATTASMGGPGFLELAGGATGACNGDSGGPVVVDGEIAGVISYGVGGCAGAVRAAAVAPALEFVEGWLAKDHRAPAGAGAGGCAAVPHGQLAWLPLAWLLFTRGRRPSARR